MRHDRIFRVVAAGLLSAAMGECGAIAADLPLRSALPPPLVITAPPVVAPIAPVMTLEVARERCAPGYAREVSGTCLRHDHLRVACRLEGCTPLPPDPIPYGIGPYLRLNY
jgi:hypothetical protein